MSTGPRRLYRSRKQRFLGGVCGGIAEYFNVDPTLVRLLWIVFCFAWGVGLLAYLIAWIIIPPAPREGTYATSSATATPSPPSNYAGWPEVSRP